MRSAFGRRSLAPASARAARALALALSLLAPLGLVAAPAAAETGRTFFVDYANGAPDADGLTRATARRLPPPPERIRPGDRILFKGGVRVPRGIRIEASGTPEAPVVYDGNSRGDWGEGPAILDGSRPLGPWTRAGTTEDGLAIWRAEAPRWMRRRDPLKSFVFQDGRLGRIASSADVEDNWADVKFERFFEVPRARATDTSLRAPEALARFPGDWTGAALRLHHGNNHLGVFPVTGVNRETGEIRHARARLIRRGDPKFAVLNHPDALDAPGELLVRPDRVLYVPFDGIDPNTAEIRMPVAYDGIFNDAADHVVVRGFRATMHLHYAFRSGFNRRSWRGRGVVFEDNESVLGGGIMVARQDEAVVRGNRITRPLRKQPIFAYDCTRLRLEDNVAREGSTGITLYGVTDSLVRGNDTRAPRGVHGNALTVYEGSHNTWILGNTVGSGVAGTAITLRESDRLLIAFNEVVARRWAVVQWAQTEGGDVIDMHNNTLIGTLRLQPATAARSRLRNNVIGKFEMTRGLDAFELRDFNLYVWPPKIGNVRAEDFRTGERRAPEHEILAAARRFDMRPRPEAREIMAAGGPVRIPGVGTVTHLGARRPDGSRVDLSGVGLPPVREAEARP